MKKYLKNQRGVTLIELLGVIVILGILAAIAVPAVLGQIDDAETGATEANIMIVLDAAERYFIMEEDAGDKVELSDLTPDYLKEVPKEFDDDYYVEDGKLYDADGDEVTVTE